MKPNSAADATVTPISLAYSVDADDAFMFHALAAGQVAAPGLAFSHQRADTAQLNRIALAGAADVVAISAGLYPQVADRYLLLPHGASVGRGFGPVVVAPRAMGTSDLAGRRVGIPGLTTTAWMVLRMIEPRAVPVEIPIVPFGRIFESLKAGEVDAALLIHEGRLIYPERGLQLVVDLGVWWQENVGLPLPLGVNVIRRDLGPARVALVSDLLRKSIGWAIDHRDQLITALASEDRGDPALANPALIDHYLSLYANADTAEMRQDARLGIEALFERAARDGTILAPIEWAP
ncbi:MAG: ABC transporter substrate-binding protein [Deltaproteobacteria bacterium]|nr:ABC transporter substrate-binding protein [Deltaproteobacteria bacterium]